MMSQVLDIVAVVLLLAGGFFMVVAAVGFIRLPDLYCRFHVTGILDTLGAPLMLLAVAVHVGFGLTFGKLILGLVFLFITAPLVGHLLSRAAVEAGYQVERKQGPAPGQGSEIQSVLHHGESEEMKRADGAKGGEA